MNNRAAESIARCISIIAQNSAKIAVIDQDHRTNGIHWGFSEARASLVKDIEKHEGYIAQWLQQPITWRNE
jgi:hypothetical protein